MSRLSVIVVADDAGISRPVNEAIVQGVLRNVISATGVMVGMPFAREAVSLFQREAPNLSMGLHFCLTSGKSLLPPESIPLLVDSEQRFCNGFGSLWRKSLLPGNKKFLQQAEAEFSAQVDWFDRNGVPLRFIDGHQHIQMIPGLFEIVQRESQKRNIFMRIPDEPFGNFARLQSRGLRWIPGGLLKKIILSTLTRLAPRPERPDSDQMIRVNYHGVLDTGAFFEDAWQAILQYHNKQAIRSGKDRTILVNIHPARRTPDAREISQLTCSRADIRFLLSPNRLREWEVVSSPELQELLRKYQAEIVNRSSTVLSPLTGTDVY